jgi:caa(3)-type oxidase subunit IV
MSDDKPQAAGDSKDTSPASDPAGSVQTTETSPTKEEASELKMVEKPVADEPEKNDGHGGGPVTTDLEHADGHDHAHAEAHDHGLAHTTPVSLLFGILAVLLVLTIATVSVTSIDLGAQGNLIVAMIIATVKAALVCTFFMHLLWDKKFHVVLFLTSVLFLILFLSMTTTDRGEYQHLVDEYRAQQLGVK